MQVNASFLDVLEQTSRGKATAHVQLKAHSELMVHIP